MKVTYFPVISSLIARYSNGFLIKGNTESVQNTTFGLKKRTEWLFFSNNTQTEYLQIAENYRDQFQSVPVSIFEYTHFCEYYLSESQSVSVSIFFIYQIYDVLMNHRLLGLDKNKNCAFSL